MPTYDGPPVPTAPGCYEVQIAKCENGFIVRVGCKTFISKEWEEVSLGLAEYWKDPVNAKKLYCKEDK